MLEYNILSYAKINLALEVVEKVNNYHKLSTLMCCLKNYYDVIKIKPSNKFSVQVSGDYNVEGENILEKVAHLFTKEFGYNVNYSINIIKNIKIGGGLGGGSSNAATFLHFLLQQNNIFLNKNAFCNFVIKIGSDVPFFFNHYPKICKNFGEKLYDVHFSIPKKLFAVIIIPHFSISTKQAFELLDKKSFNPLSRFDSFEDVIKSQNPFTLSINNLHKDVLKIIETLKSIQGCIKADISGSGSCLFGLFEGDIKHELFSKALKDYNYVVSSIIL